MGNNHFVKILLQHIISSSKDFTKLIKDLQLLLNSDSVVRRVVSPAPIVSHRSTRKIKDYIVISKLYPIEKRVETFRCGKRRFQVCTSVEATDTFF